MSWVSCSDRQPKHAGHYLVECGVSKQKFRAFYNPRQKQWLSSKTMLPITFGNYPGERPGDRWKEHSHLRVNAKGPNSLHPM